MCVGQTKPPNSAIGPHYRPVRPPAGVAPSPFRFGAPGHVSSSPLGTGAAYPPKLSGKSLRYKLSLPLDSGTFVAGSFSLAERDENTHLPMDGGRRHYMWGTGHRDGCQCPTAYHCSWRQRHGTRRSIIAQVAGMPTLKKQKYKETRKHRTPRLRKTFLLQAFPPTG